MESSIWKGKMYSAEYKKRLKTDSTHCFHINILKQNLRFLWKFSKIWNTVPNRLRGRVGETVPGLVFESFAQRGKGEHPFEERG
jgi:hypothetical protein